MFLLSLPMRGAWIEMLSSFISSLLRKSLPMRGAWIEILRVREPLQIHNVAPHAGSVD